MIISKADFVPALVQFSANTPDELINPPINQAIKFDLKEVLPGQIWAKVLLFPAFTAAEFVPETAYPADSYVRIDEEDENGFLVGKVYQSQVPQVEGEEIELDKPTPDNTQWAYVDLPTFINEFIKPFLVIAAYMWYSKQGGAIETPTGTRVFKEDFSDPISGSQHATQLAALKLLRGKYAELVTNELVRRSYVIDEVSYAPANCFNPTKTAYKGGISAL